MKKIKLFLLLMIFAIRVSFAQNSLPQNGNIGIGTLSPTTAIQIGGFNNGLANNQLLIPGVYNFEQIRLGQIGNGNGSLEFVNHTDITKSYGIKFLVDIDHGASGLQLQYASPTTSYQSLNYITGFYMNTSGNIGIGTTDTKGYKLAVSGNMIAESVKVKLQGQWPDYVFAEDYRLKDLKDLENYIKENKHLPDMPTGAEAEKNGINLGEMNAKLLQKIEELTLHLIEKDKQITRLQDEFNLMDQKLNYLMKNYFNNGVSD